MSTPQFRTVRMLEGYRRQDVDDLLAEVARRRAQGQFAGLADRIRAASFAPTRFQAGYNQDDVDEYLETLIAQVSAEHPEPSRTRPGTGPSRLERPAFRATNWAEGYSIVDVDAFLTEVESRLAQGRTEGLADVIRSATFEASRFQPGYNQDDVDDYLDVLVTKLRGDLPPPYTSPGR